MITQERADGYARIYIYRTGQSLRRWEPLFPTVFAVMMEMCEAAKLSASAGPAAALWRIGAPGEDVPYG